MSLIDGDLEGWSDTELVEAVAALGDSIARRLHRELRASLGRRGREHVREHYAIERLPGPVSVSKRVRAPIRPRAGILNSRCR